MANADKPRGFRPSHHMHGGEIRVNTVRGYPYLIDSNTAGALAKGDRVILEATGNIELGAADDGANSVGIFAGCRYTDANGDRHFSDYIPATKTSFTNMEADVWDDPAIVFIGQADSGSTPAATDVGATCNDADGGSDSTRKLSGFELDSSDIGTGAQWKIVGKLNTPNNDWGEHVDLLVIANEHLYKAAVAGV